MFLDEDWLNLQQQKDEEQLKWIINRVWTYINIFAYQIALN